MQHFPCFFKESKRQKLCREYTIMLSKVVHVAEQVTTLESYSKDLDRA